MAQWLQLYTRRSARQGSIPSQGKDVSQILDYTFCLFDPDHTLRNQRNRHYIRKSLSNVRRTAIAQWLYKAKCSPGFDTQPGSRSQPNLRLYLFVLNYTFLIPTIYFAISVIDNILKNHSRKPEEEPWFSGLSCGHDCKPTGSTPSFVFCSRLNFLITAHLFNNKHDTM